MKSLSYTFTALALCTVFTVSSVLPAEALPIPQQQARQSSDVQNVKEVIRKVHPNRRSGFNRNNRGWHGKYSRSHSGYWRGHRGYRNYRPGYRRYNGFWYPAAVFATGVVIGTTAHRGGNGHVRWCRAQYRSYRASDNTFQPYNGPRKQCVSP